MACRDGQAGAVAPGLNLIGTINSSLRNHDGKGVQVINKPFHEVLNSGTGAPNNADLASARYRGPGPSARLHMLAEKFILVLETLISRTYPTGARRR